MTFSCQLREEITTKTQEVDRENRRKSKLEKDLKFVAAELEERNADLKAREMQLQGAEEEFKRCEQQLRETRVRQAMFQEHYASRDFCQVQYERSVKDNEILNQRLNKAQHDYENQLMQSDQLAGENSQKLAELRLKEDEIANLKTDISRVNKLREGLNRKLRMMEEQKNEMESSRESLRQHITSLERGKGLIFNSLQY